MKKLLVHLCITLVFALLTAIYFAPEVFHDKTLRNADGAHAVGMAHEMMDYEEANNVPVAWTNSMFSGMPTYQIRTPGVANYPSPLFRYQHAFNMLGNGRWVFLSLLFTYIFLVGMGYSIPIAVTGAVAYSLASYSIIILPAGHLAKVQTMVYIPLVLMGMALVFKKKWMLGGVVFALSLSLELASNHVQITYYLMLLCLVFALAYVISFVRDRDYRGLLKASGTLASGCVIALSCNAANLYSSWQLTKSSTRGPSRLSSHVDGKADKSSGLDRDYAFAWSYGKAELLTLLVPNVYGGESGGSLGKDSHLAKQLQSRGYQVPADLRAATYWGTQPFTSGPVYFGAGVCFLALLALCICRQNSYRFWILGAFVFFCIMACGRNMPLINNFLFDYLPRYNIFRTPSMALVIPQFLAAVLACMALRSVAEGNIDDKLLKKGVYVAGGVTGGLCLLLWIMPTAFFDFSCPADDKIAAQVGDWYLSALVQDREALASSDALRSLFFVAATAALVWLFGQKQRRGAFNYALCGIALLTLVDLWNIDRRYLNDSHFVRPSEAVVYEPTVADNIILQDKDASYRVLTFNDPFNDTHVAYFHKAIGGYNAAKLRDYQDLIDQHIEPEMRSMAANLQKVRSMADLDSLFRLTPVLNMLNMRYAIVNDDAAPLRNSHAMGNAWFATDVVVARDTVIAGNAFRQSDVDIKLLGSVDLRRKAVVEADDVDKLNGWRGSADAFPDSSASISLTSYAPIKLTYEANSLKGGLAVFSEVFYPNDWKAYVDGKEVPFFRTNWILRGLMVPAGKHTITFENKPETYFFLRTLGSGLQIVMVLSLLCFAAFYGRRWWLAQKSQPSFVDSVRNGSKK